MKSPRSYPLSIDNGEMIIFFWELQMSPFFGTKLKWASGPGSRPWPPTGTSGWGNSPPCSLLFVVTMGSIQAPGPQSIRKEPAAPTPGVSLTERPPYSWSLGLTPGPRRQEPRGWMAPTPTGWAGAPGPAPCPCSGPGHRLGPDQLPPSPAREASCWGQGGEERVAADMTQGSPGL